MKITGIETYLMSAATGKDSWSRRNWLFVKVRTDEGSTASARRAAGRAWSRPRSAT